MSDIEAFHDGVSACTECAVFRSRGYWKFPAEAHGNPASPVWILGACPRKIDDDLRAGRSPRYWTGQSARNLRQPIEEHFGKSLEELVYLSDVVKCQCDGTPFREPLGTCPDLWLRPELGLLQPKAILSLGKDAMKALADCQDIVARFEVEVIQLPHPSPANGNEIRRKYGDRLWSAYRTEVVEVVARWLR
ncbi:MAG: uracil-DNA glycosylase family protein [Chloroflexi bacterium]|nr:uracil-DNA glycosylase family protein [Chloroflexota bacterium]